MNEIQTNSQESEVLAAKNTRVGLDLAETATEAEVKAAREALTAKNARRGLNLPETATEAEVKAAREALTAKNEQRN